MTRATGPRYAVHFRRRRRGKTNYRKRLALLKSGVPRLVVRKTNRGVIAQLVAYSPKGDAVIACAYSNELKKMGFPAKRNTPTAYLTGLLLASKALSSKALAGEGKNASEIVLDCGLHQASKGGLLYAALKGAVDGGLKASCSQERFPSEDRIQGKHLSQETREAFAKTMQEIRKGEGGQEIRKETLKPRAQARPETKQATPETRLETPETKQETPETEAKTEAETKTDTTEKDEGNQNA